MKTPVAVIDTSVVVSGMLTCDGAAPTALLLDGMLAGTFCFLLSQELIAEYRTVLLRPRIVKRRRLSERQIDGVLTDIIANGVVRETGAPSAAAPDPGDEHLWALAETQKGTIIVTGDHLLLDHPPAHASVMSPLAFLDLLGSRSAGS